MSVQIFIVQVLQDTKDLDTKLNLDMIILILFELETYMMNLKGG